ncbi:transposase [Escherichia coli]|nr:transposase [Escherichia coli]OAS84458.1 transposase [Escherichia coli]
MLFRQRTQASVARAVVILRKKIACHKVNSDARYVDIQRTPM